MMLSSRRMLASLILRPPGVARCASHSAPQESAFQAIKVRCGGSGDTTIHIHNPPTTTPLPLLLYIAPTFEQSPLTTPSISPSFLSNSHTTVLISPSFSPATPFPQPLHVLSFAFSAILEQHTKSRDVLSPKKSSKLPPISAYGSALGGTLATALALTECRPLSDTKTYIDALMTRDAIYDYSPLANTYLSQYTSSKAVAQEPEFDRHAYLSTDSDLAYANVSPPSNDYISGPSISASASTGHTYPASTREGLIKSLPHIFTKPEVAYDPFISPLLFFRGRSHEIPTSWTWRGPPGGRQPRVSLEERRMGRSYVKFPTMESGLAIPWTRLCVSGNESEAPKKRSRSKRAKAQEQVADVDGEDALQELYAEQAELMAAGMRRAIEKGHEDPRLLAAMGIEDVDAEERVQVVHGEDRDTERERDEMDGVAMNEWLRDIRG